MAFVTGQTRSLIAGTAPGLASLRRHWLRFAGQLPLLPLAILIPFCLVAALANFISPYDPTEPIPGAKIFEPPFWVEGANPAALLGTDFQGRDVVIRRHVVPNVLNSAMVLASLTIGVVIIAEASLSFLGVGVPPPEPAWGSMLADGRSMLMVGDWWLTVFPGLCIMMVVLATQLMGDWLRIRLDPQLRNL